MAHPPPPPPLPPPPHVTPPPHIRALVSNRKREGKKKKWAYLIYGYFEGLSTYYVYFIQRT
jgi:hypothetical protein